MLVLTRKIDEGVTITTSDGPIRVVLLQCDRGKAQIGFEAPRHLPIARDELLGTAPGGEGRTDG